MSIPPHPCRGETCGSLQFSRLTPAALNSGGCGCHSRGAFHSVKRLTQDCDQIPIAALNMSAIHSNIQKPHVQVTILCKQEIAPSASLGDSSFTQISKLRRNQQKMQWFSLSLPVLWYHDKMCREWRNQMYTQKWKGNIAVSLFTEYISSYNGFTVLHKSMQTQLRKIE